MKLRPLVAAFDNNIIDALIEPGNQARIGPTLERAERGEVEFYATQELIEEAWRVIETHQPGRLRLFGSVVGALTQGRHLWTLEAVVKSELLGKAQAFAPEEERAKMFGHLRLIYEGRPNMRDVKAIADEARRKKDEAFERWKRDAAAARKILDALKEDDRKGVLALSFEEFDEFEWTRHGRDVAAKHAREAGAENPDVIADRVMAEPGSFPFTRRFVAVLSLLKWWWTSQQRAVKEGDQNDARQLTILPAVDRFITNDKAIREWSRALGDPGGKVLTFEEFLAS